MSPCGEVAVSIASRPSVPPPMYCAAATLSTAFWKVASCDLAAFGGCGIGGVLCLRGLLHCQLVGQIQLGGVHRLGGLLGLPRQLVELCQRVIGGIRLHIPGEDAAEDRYTDYRTDDGSLECHG